MRVGDIVIVSNLGEMKIYKAEPRDLEAEAGLKPNNVKLDLIDAKDYVVSHWKIQDIVTDEAGQFKGGSQGRGEFTQGSIGHRHELEKRVEAEVIDAIAKDISDAVEANNPPKWFLGLPETIYDRVIEKVSPSAKEKLFLGLRKDLTKADKKDLVGIFKKKLS
ncbi:host attachment protein [Hydrogenimonas sp.]